MKDQPIEALMADPAFDPTFWMLTAFKKYIEANPQIILGDEVCRPYLLDALETDADWRKTIRRMSAQEHIVNDVINALQRSRYLREGKWAQMVQKQLFEKLTTLEEEDPNNHGKWAKYLLQLTLTNAPPTNLLNVLTPRQILTGTRVWNTSDYKMSYWLTIVDRLDNDSILQLIGDQDFPEKLLTMRVVTFGTSDFEIERYQNRIIKFQDLLIKILARIVKSVLTPLELFEAMVSRITPEGLERLYSQVKKKDEFVEDPRIHRNQMVENEWEDYEPELVKIPPRISDLLCRCGYMCRSASGFTLHRKNCEIGREFLPVNQVLRICQARHGQYSLNCQKCGKICQSKSGQTLHSKKCKKNFTETELLGIVSKQED